MGEIGMDQSPILLQLVRHSCPNVLYHYTNREGLVSILNSWEIWATKIQYLNDTSEFDLALRLARNYLAEKEPGASEEEKESIKTGLREIDSIKQINVFVSSFSEKRDSLSQWRGYGSGNASYSIGFRSGMLKGIAKRNDFLLAKCVYDEQEHKQIYAPMWEWALADVQRLTRSGRHSNFLTQLMRIAPLLKNKHFRDESEWRIISGAISASHAKFDFHTGASMIIPHFKCSLGLVDGFKRVDEIVVGPCPHMDLAEDAVLMLCFKRKINHRAIGRSEIPDRNW